MAVTVPLPEKPILFFISLPADGHIIPILTIAAHFASQGYHVALMSAGMCREKIEKAGVEFIDSGEDMALLDKWRELMPPEIAHLPSSSVEAKLRRFVHTFYKPLRSRLEAAVRALEMLYKRNPGRQIILLEDALGATTMPLVFGARQPAGFERPVKRIGISTTFSLDRSRDLAPCLLGLPPDATESGRLRNQVLASLMDAGPLVPLFEGLKEALVDCQCTSFPTQDPLSINLLSYDATVALCSPGMEYPRSDKPQHLHFVGTLPRIPSSDKQALPEWWSEVTSAAAAGSKKKVVFVCQGTFNTDHHELIQPTLKGLANREDLLVVAALGVRGLALADDISVPANARVIDYLSYHAVLEHADVFVSNAGYGALSHAVINGVPSVLAGTSEEKVEVAMRATVAGVARNLHTQEPTPEQVRDAVDDILTNESFKARAMELKRENEDLDSLRGIEEIVLSFVER